MSVELKVPAVGESISSVTIGQWLVQPGQSVARDATVVVLETDKVNVEVPAPVAGRLKEVFKKAGESAAVGDVLAILEEGKVGTPPDTPTVPNMQPTAAEKPADKEKPAPGDGQRPPLPAAQRLIEEKGLNVADIQGTGKSGQVTKEDVLKHTGTATPKPAPAPVATQEKPAPTGSRHTESVPMTPLRKTIARRLVEAQQTGALLTTFNEVDMSAVMELRKQHQEEFQARHGTKLGIMSFFVKAAVEALKAFPAINAEIQGDNILYRNYYDVGVAVGGGKGLVVPVLRNAERLSFAEVEKQIKDFAVRAQAGKLKLEELQGGTFTISNGGVYGSLLSTPIINPPQSGVLGLHKTQERPIAVNGQVLVRPMMYLALTYDHRLVDGREAVSFLIRVKDCVENPTRILLEV